MSEKEIFWDLTCIYYTSTHKHPHPSSQQHTMILCYVYSYTPTFKHAHTSYCNVCTNLFVSNENIPDPCWVRSVLLPQDWSIEILILAVRVLFLYKQIIIIFNRIIMSIEASKFHWSLRCRILMWQKWIVEWFMAKQVVYE